MKIEDLAMEIAGHTHRHELEHLSPNNYSMTYLRSSAILDDMEETGGYNGDIDDLIDAIHEENQLWYALEEVLDKHFPDLDDKDDILCDLIETIEELNGDAFPD